MAKKKTATKVEKRKFTRFTPDIGTLGFLLAEADGKALKPMIPCLVLEESFAGCGLIAVKNPLLVKGAEFKVKIGRLSVMKAQIRWVKVLDRKFTYFGIEYV